MLHDGHTAPEAARILHCDPKTVRSTVARYFAGAPLALQGRKGVKHASRNCTAPVEAELLKLLKQDECLYLNELAAELRPRCLQSPAGNGMDSQQGESGLAQQNSQAALHAAASYKQA